MISRVVNGDGFPRKRSLPGRFVSHIFVIHFNPMLYQTTCRYRDEFQGQPKLPVGLGFFQVEVRHVSSSRELRRPREYSPRSPRLLEHEGYQCAEACTSQEAVELAQQRRPECILLDPALSTVDLDVPRWLRADPRTSAAHTRGDKGVGDAVGLKRPGPGEDLWALLADADAETAGRAVFALADAPAEALAIMRKRLHPVTVSADRLLKNLHRLDLYGTNWVNFKVLARLEKLEMLQIWGSDLTVQAMQEIALLGNLRVLSINNAKVIDVGLEARAPASGSRGLARVTAIGLSTRRRTSENSH